ncbi:MAG: ABC transporter permease [Asticcacaulis sp.]
MSLALATLIYEWQRFIAAVISLAMVGLLVLGVTGLFAGVLQSYTATIERSPADFLVESVVGESGRAPKRRDANRLYSYDSLADSQELFQTQSRWENVLPRSTETNATEPSASRKSAFVNILVINPYEGDLSVPRDFTSRELDILREPKVVMVDRSALNALGVKKVGDLARINRQTVRLGGILTNYANPLSPNVFMSRQTASLLGLKQSREEVGDFAVRIDPGKELDAAQSELNDVGSSVFVARRPAEIAARLQKELLGENIIGTILRGLMIFSAVIGVMVTWQTMRGAILASIREFASMRALGVPMAKLRWVIVELGFWVGVAGVLFTGVFASVAAWLGNSIGVPVVYPPVYVATVAVLLILVAVGAGVLSIGTLNKGQPMDLLK